MTGSHRKNVVILESERDTGELFARALEQQRRCKCYVAYSLEEAMDLLKSIPIGLLIVDMKLAMADDFGLVRKVRRNFPATVIVVVGYLHQKDLVHKAVSAGARGHVTKPITLDSFRRKIEEYTVQPESSAV